MARCKECIHYAVCGKQRFIVQVNRNTFDEYNQVDGVEKYCYEYTPPAAYVAPRAEVAREIFARIEELIEMTAFADCWSEGGFRNDIAELKKKYTEEK